ncbi:unnamed protein product [Polarella glacialis]|uniref:Uncharacterized protein n=1 Tax=Polarella glacialis TaxID=89957 RepID=A0A813HJF1_POLGL|nr:unnamed protein product [Polarella glacialis]
MPLQEFCMAWEARQFSAMWQASRRLTGKVLGPKRRRFDTPMSEQPDKAKWVAHFSQPGPGGGCVATVANMEELFAKEAELQPICGLQTARRRAHKDFDGLCNQLRTHPLRKGFPRWGVSAEVWPQLLSPGQYREKCRHGVGFAHPEIDMYQFRLRLFQLLVSSKRYVNAPVLWRRSDSRATRDYVSGYAKGKSRIESIIQQHVVCKRLAQARIGCVRSFYDVANAFPSMDHDYICDGIDAAALPADQPLLHQRVNILWSTAGRKIFLLHMLTSTYKPYRLWMRLCGTSLPWRGLRSIFLGMVYKSMDSWSKSGANEELEIRELQSAVFRTCLLDVSNPFVNAITTAAMAQKIEQSSQAAIAAHRAAITSPKDLSGIIYITKLKKAWAKNTFKLHLAAHPSHQDLLDYVETALVSSGATPKKGQAPANGMVRELQTLLDELAVIAKCFTAALFLITLPFQQRSPLASFSFSGSMSLCHRSSFFSQPRHKRMKRLSGRGRLLERQRHMAYPPTMFDLIAFGSAEQVLSGLIRRCGKGGVPLTIRPDRVLPFYLVGKEFELVSAVGVFDQYELFSALCSFRSYHAQEKKMQDHVHPLREVCLRSASVSPLQALSETDDSSPLAPGPSPSISTGNALVSGMDFDPGAPPPDDEGYFSESIIYLSTHSSDDADNEAEIMKARLETDFEDEEMLNLVGSLQESRRSETASSGLALQQAFRQRLASQNIRAYDIPQALSGSRRYLKFMPQ